MFDVSLKRTDVMLRERGLRHRLPWRQYFCPSNFLIIPWSLTAIDGGCGYNSWLGFLSKPAVFSGGTCTEPE